MYFGTGYVPCASTSARRTSSGMSLASTLSSVVGDTQQGIQPAQLGDERPGGGAVVLVSPHQPARPCKLRQGSRGLVEVEVQNIGQDNRVHQPMRQVVDRADLVRNGMDISNARLCEGKARLT